MRTSPGRLTLLAFAGVVLLGGLQWHVDRRAQSVELPPLWAGVLRFGLASLVFFALVRHAARALASRPGAGGQRPLRRARLRRGVRAGVLVACVQAGPGTTQVILALVPLLTFLLAVAQRLERFRLQGLAGALLAVGGVALVFVEKLGVQAVSLALSVCLPPAWRLLKRTSWSSVFPHAHPLANNAVAMGVGALMLIVLSLPAGETWTLPAATRLDRGTDLPGAGRARSSFSRCTCT